MATLYTHAFFGLGLAQMASRRRLRPLFWILAAVLPVIPDVDAFSPYAYGSIWGHRGFTHSLCFALAISLVAAAAACRFLGVRFWPLWVVTVTVFRGGSRP